MPKYSGKDSIKSGIPLGGIGAGKLEILPNGTLDLFTFLNNQDKPLTDFSSNIPAGVLGFHFAVFTEKNNAKVGKLLQTVPVGEYPIIENIDFEGAFPYARLNYKDREIPITITLDASSCFIPQDEKKSALPLSSFVFRLQNPTKDRISATLLAIGRNIVSNWAVGRYNTITNDKKFLSLDFKVKAALELDVSAGVLSIAVAKAKGLDITYLGAFNMHSVNFIFNKENINLAPFDYLKSFNRLPDIDTQKPVESESVQLGGAIAVDIELEPSEYKEILFYFCWNFPNCKEGHIYSKWFATTGKTISFALSSKKALSKANSFLRGRIEKTSLPSWLQDALLNNLYPFFSSSLWNKKDQFELLEAPEVCPLVGTLDVRFYSSIATLLFFPRLELKALRQFAKAQREDGYIPHDLGRNRFDLPSNGTTNLFWKDLNPKFILMTYRDFLWTQDKAFLAQMYPVCKKALDWEIATDKNKDFLPDSEGQDQTFDLWPLYGASSYVSNIYLAALLAMKEMSGLMRNTKTHDFCDELFIKGRRNFLKKLWNNNYFICYNNGKDINNACTAAQLMGQWYAHLLGLGYLVDKAMVHKALREIFSLNMPHSQWGVVNSVLPNGEIDNTCSHSRNVWIGINYALCSLAIYEGFIDEALSLAKKVWDNVSSNIQNPWNQPDMVDARSGQYLFGDHYMREMAIWAIPLALSQRDKKLKSFIDSIKKYGSA